MKQKQTKYIEQKINFHHKNAEVKKKFKFFQIKLYNASILHGSNGRKNIDDDFLFKICERVVLI